MSSPQPVVAIDGPSGSGKSTVARALARAHSWRYVDTGAMYRALAWLVADSGVNASDDDAVAAAAETIDLHLTDDPNDACVRVGSVDVTAAIRTPEVTDLVSITSAVPRVRELMVARQRQLARGGGVVMEGRDIGTTVLPGATLKVFLTASETERAGRRSAEAGIDRTAVGAAIARRDRIDSTRTVSPLTVAADAIVIDSTELSVEGVVARIEAELSAVGALRSPS